ncbi:MAG: hypothetical protein ACOYXT_12765 [Bacteroidota bacterium]
METSKRSDEIDLFDLAGGVVRAVRQNRIKVILCFVVSLGLGSLLYFISPKVWQSKMIILSDILTETYAGKLAEKFGTLIREGNYQTLAERLSLTPDQARHVKMVRIEGVLDRETVLLEEDKRLNLMVTVEVTDNSILPDLQKGIIRYFENNEFVKFKVDQKRRYFANLIAKVKSEIAKLDALKEKIALGQYKPDAGLYLLDPTNPFSRSVELYKQQLDYENSLELVNSIKVIDNFTAHRKPIKPRLEVILLGSLLAGIVLATIVLFVHSLNLRLKEN